MGVIVATLLKRELWRRILLYLLESAAVTGHLLPFAVMPN